MHIITQCKTKNRYFESGKDGRMTRVSRFQYEWNEALAYRIDCLYSVGDRNYRTLYAPYPFSGHKVSQ